MQVGVSGAQTFHKECQPLGPKHGFKPNEYLLTSLEAKSEKEVHLLHLLSWDFVAFCWLFWFPTPGHAHCPEILLCNQGFGTPPAPSWLPNLLTFPLVIGFLFPPGLDSLHQLCPAMLIGSCLVNYLGQYVVML